MTSTNSLSPSPFAPSSASFKSWVRRASDSMMRSGTLSWAILAATCELMDGSNELTFDATLGAGIDGRIHTRADAEAGPEFAGGGRAAPALLDAQPAIPGPAPTVSVIIDVQPSASPAPAPPMQAL